MTLGTRSSGLSTATRRVLADEVVDAIRTAIVTGVIEAGTRLIEGELATQLQVSRSPVREALARLELEGLVVTERHRGSTVAQFSPGDVGELYSLRSALERLGAEQACRCASDEDLAAVGQVLDGFNKLPRPLTRTAVANLDVNFHDAIFSAAHHDRLYRAWTMLRPQISLSLLQRGAFRPDYTTTWQEDHQELLDALKARKAATAAKIVEAHIEGTYRRVSATEELKVGTVNMRVSPGTLSRRRTTI